MGESEAQLARRRARAKERRETEPEYRERENAECRAYYARNSETQRARTAAWRAAHPELLQSSRRASYAKYAAWVRSLKIGKSCLDCGLACTDENYWAFDWDHRPGVVKLFAVSQASRERRTQAEVLAEIAKCDLRCRNCHAVITHQRRNSGNATIEAYLRAQLADERGES